MRKFSTFIIFFSVIALNISAQNPFEFGGEYIRFVGKGYNSGKAAARAESFSDKNSFSAGITYQLASKKSYSVSHGLGIYFSYRHAFSNKLTGSSPFAGARLSFSLENFEGQTKNNSLFITPWAELGYHFIFSKHIFTAPAIGYGYTLKMSKDYNSLNEDDGGRLIPSLSAGYRFY